MPSPKYIPLRRLLAVIALALTWGGVVSFRTLWSLIRKGPRRVLIAKKRDIRPAVMDNPELGTHHYARMKNITLHYVAKGPEDKPLVLFLHGFPELWYSWRFQLKDLSQEYRAVAVDMRGYGESDKPQGITEYHVQKLTADIKELVQYLGYQKCYLVGHDWGALVAWACATKYPELVEKLIVCNVPNPFAFIKHIRGHVSQLMKSWYMFFFQIPYLPELVMGFNDLAFVSVKAKNRTSEDTEVYKYTYRNFVDRTGPINYYRSIMRYKFDRTTSSKVKSPTLIIWGTRDPFLDSEMAELSKKYVEADCLLCYITGAGHCVQQDEPDIVNKYIRNFLIGKKPAGSVSFSSKV